MKIEITGFESRTEAKEKDFIETTINQIGLFLCND